MIKLHGCLMLIWLLLGLYQTVAVDQKWDHHPGKLDQSVISPVEDSKPSSPNDPQVDPIYLEGQAHSDKARAGLKAKQKGFLGGAVAAVKSVATNVVSKVKSLFTKKPEPEPEPVKAPEPAKPEPKPEPEPEPESEPGSFEGSGSGSGSDGSAEVIPEQCPDECNGRGICREQIEESYVTSTGYLKHPFKCECDPPWVGPSCATRNDLFLNYLLSNGTAPRPPCCKVCSEQLQAPESFKDIPKFLNPFTTVDPDCELHFSEDTPRHDIWGRQKRPCVRDIDDHVLAFLEVDSELAFDQSYLSRRRLLSKEKTEEEWLAGLAVGAAAGFAGTMLAKKISSPAPAAAAAPAPAPAPAPAAAAGASPSAGADEGSGSLAYILEDCCVMCDFWDLPENAQAPLMPFVEEYGSDSGSGASGGDDSNDYIHGPHGTPVPGQRDEEEGFRIQTGDCCAVCPLEAQEEYPETPEPFGSNSGSGSWGDVPHHPSGFPGNDHPHVTAPPVVSGSFLQKKQASFLQEMERTRQAQAEQYRPPLTTVQGCCNVCPSQFFVSTTTRQRGLDMLGSGSGAQAEEDLFDSKSDEQVNKACYDAVYAEIGEPKRENALRYVVLGHPLSVRLTAAGRVLTIEDQKTRARESTTFSENIQDDVRAACSKILGDYYAIKRGDFKESGDDRNFGPGGPGPAPPKPPPGL